MRQCEGNSDSVLRDVSNALRNTVHMFKRLSCSLIISYLLQGVLNMLHSHLFVFFSVSLLLYLSQWELFLSKTVLNFMFLQLESCKNLKMVSNEWVEGSEVASGSGIDYHY